MTFQGNPGMTVRCYYELMQKFKRNLSAQLSVNSSFIQKVVFNEINVAQNQTNIKPTN